MTATSVAVLRLLQLKFLCDLIERLMESSTSGTKGYYRIIKYVSRANASEAREN